MEPLFGKRIVSLGERWWGLFMQNWYLGRRSVWSVAGQFTLVTALVMTVAVIAKFGL